MPQQIVKVYSTVRSHKSIVFHRCMSVFETSPFNRRSVKQKLFLDFSFMIAGQHSSRECGHRRLSVKITPCYKQFFGLDRTKPADVQSLSVSGDFRQPVIARGNR